MIPFPFAGVGSNGGKKTKAWSHPIFCGKEGACTCSCMAPAFSIMDKASPWLCLMCLLLAKCHSDWLTSVVKWSHQTWAIERNLSEAANIVLCLNIFYLVLPCHAVAMLQSASGQLCCVTTSFDASSLSNWKPCCASVYQGKSLRASTQ